MITFVATAHNETTEAYLFISSLLLQTNPNWKCKIYCDKNNEYIKNVVNHFNDCRIEYFENEVNTGFWGHYNRIKSLNEISTEYFIQTSIQDYYLPITISEIYKYIDNQDILLFNCLHNHFKYDTLITNPIRCQVDWGTCVVKTEIAKKVGINHPESKICDGLFIEEFCKFPNIKLLKINKTLTIHN
jgi:hypothetical protein